MGLLEFIKKKLGLGAEPNESFETPETNDKFPSPTTGNDEPTFVDRTGWTGEDFEFIILGDIDVFSDFDNIMTPNSLEWTKTNKNNWDFYQVGQDEFSYSVEEPGIQMTFNKEIIFDKAKKIGDEVIANIIATGQEAELLILDNKKNYRFD
jgi:hypothetical protein